MIDSHVGQTATEVELEAKTNSGELLCRKQLLPESGLEMCFLNEVPHSEP